MVHASVPAHPAVRADARHARSVSSGGPSKGGGCWYGITYQHPLLTSSGKEDINV